MCSQSAVDTVPQHRQVTESPSYSVMTGDGVDGASMTWRRSAVVAGASARVVPQLAQVRRDRHATIQSVGTVTEILPGRRWAASRVCGPDAPARISLSLASSSTADPAKAMRGVRHTPAWPQTLYPAAALHGMIDTPFIQMNSNAAVRVAYCGLVRDIRPRRSPIGQAAWGAEYVNLVALAPDVGPTASLFDATPESAPRGGTARKGSRLNPVGYSPQDLRLRIWPTLR